jgi:putative NADPH-quinone reductase
MGRIAVIVGHARKDTFCEALGNAYVEGARAAGHSVEMFVTSRMSFDPILHEGYDRVQALEPDLVAAHSAIMQADHLVLIFPLWLGTLPAIFKGFLERVLQPDIIGPAREGRFVPLLKGKSARVIMTMGMPGLVYRWWYGAHALKMLKRNILEFLGVTPVRSTLFGMIGAVGAGQLDDWVEEVRALGGKGE